MGQSHKLRQPHPIRNNKTYLKHGIKHRNNDYNSSAVGLSCYHDSLFYEVVNGKGLSEENYLFEEHRQRGV